LEHIQDSKFAYIVRRIDYDFFPLIQGNVDSIFFHRGVSNHLCLFIWLFKYLEMEKDVVIFGENNLLEKYLPGHCEDFVQGTAFHQSDEDDAMIDSTDQPICRNILKCQITKMY
jgi:hypothetical protein